MRRARSATLAAAAVALVAIACAGPDPVETTPAPAAYHARVDLWIDPPRFEDGGDGAATRSAAEYGTHHGGEGKRLQTTGTIQGLLQEPGRRLVKRLELEGPSHFEFQPLLAPDGRPCGCSFVVSVREADGSERRLASVPQETDQRFGPATEFVDLSALAGRPVELVLEIATADGETGGAALWGSPTVVTTAPAPPPASGPPARPNVLFIVADTLRADALGAWGREPSMTPALDWLAAESEVWLEAYSSLNSTNPSFTSLFTGLYAKNHGIYDHMTLVGEERTTLAESFQQAGYRSMAVFAARHVGVVGLEQGFNEVYAASGVFTARLAVDQTLRWLDVYGGGPWFAMVHLFDVHMPHTPPFPFAEGLVASRRYGLGAVEEWREFRDGGVVDFDYEGIGGGAAPLYFSELASMDRQLDRLFGYLESRGLLEQTVVAFTADHGENLGDHGILYDHRGLYDTTTHVPLMIRWPGEPERRGRRPELVQNMDVHPTLLEAAGIAPPEAVDAVSLLALASRTPAGRRAVFSEHANRWGETLRDRSHRYVEYREAGEFGTGARLYDHESDPAEEQDVLSLQEKVAARLGAALRAWRELRPYSGETRPAELDQRSLEQLRALGYLN